jgi:hypothetical protein
MMLLSAFQNNMDNESEEVLRGRYMCAAREAKARNILAIQTIDLTTFVKSKTKGIF